MTLKIATRLWLPTIAVTGLLLLVAGLATLRTGSQIALAEAQSQSQESKLYDAATWQGLTTANAARVMAGIIGSDAAVEASLKPEIEATSARIDEIAKRIEAEAASGDEKAALGRIAGARKAYIDARQAATKVRADGNADAARAQLTGTVQPALAAYLASQQAYVALQQDIGKTLRAQAGADRMATVWSVVGVLALIVLGLAIGTVLTVRSICSPMASLTTIARRIGEGDLDVEIEHSADDEIGAVMRSLAAMRDALRGIVGQVRQAAESIQVASAEVASGNIDLSQRTEQAASNLQQTASSLEQLTGNVRQSADAAAQANQLAASASAVARRGGDVVSQVVSTMDEINGSSKRIADIIGTIDGIAFQTNILALNAAVEAARAGEQGRGFAVVASEVRSLAQRSAEAAREIKTLIGASVEKVETGARLVQDAGSTMGEIVASVQRVTDIIGEITAAAGEQSVGIGSVNGAVNNLDQMTQQNAALVEQSAAAAESLREQAQRLSASMQVFRLSAAHAQAHAQAQASTPAKPFRPVAAASGSAARAPSRPIAAPARKPLATPAAAAAPAATTVAAHDGGDWESF
jgi:methyl-accepting chemotaxis protein